MKMLQTYKLKKTEFTKILRTFSIYTEKVTDLNKYKCGYWNKNTIYYNEDHLICTESHLKYLNLLSEEYYTDWKQVVIEIDNTAQESYITPDISGSVAKAIIIKNLKKVYSIKAINDILNSYNDAYDYNKKQFHILPDRMGLTIYKNCTGYDINGAHNDALREMFPKANNYFTKLFNERKEKPNNKKIVNYYVGTLNLHQKDDNGEVVYTEFPGAYNHIVQRTTAKLLKGITEVDGTTLYANTDGFITQNALYELEDSKELGKFKLEMKGDLYTYRDKNYWCIQYINSKGEVELKGNVVNEVRNQINLFEGKVVHYDKVLNEFGQYEAKNITTEIIKGETIC